MAKSTFLIWPLGIVFFFIVLAGVEGVILYKAIDGRPDLVEPQPYEKALMYQETLDKKNYAAQLGLQATLSIGKHESTTGREVTLHLSSKKSLEDIRTIRVTAKRADNALLDEEAILIHHGKPGNIYQGVMQLRQKGLWLFEIEIGESKHTALVEQKLFIQ